MWNLLKISQQTYFIYCNINNPHDVTFILYDLKTTWSQTLTLQNVKKNVKLLNKRLDFNVDNIKEALLGNVIQSAVLEEGSDQDSCILKLKYRVKSCILSYEWTLRKENLIEFQQNFVHPLLLALLGCHEQVEILTESIRKKDIELKQFQIEGSVLNRKTLVTKPFDFHDFNQKYHDINQTAVNFKALAEYVKKNESKEGTDVLKPDLKLSSTEEGIKTKENSKDQQSSKMTVSPRQRKRKVNERKMEHLDQHLKLRRQGLEYLSSQSQTATSGNSQAIEETELRDLQQQQEQNNIKDAQNEARLTRKSRRLTPTVKYFMSSGDSTDSDNEETLKTLSGRKSTRSTVSLSKDSKKNSNNEKNTNNNGEGKKPKCVKSLSLSNNSRSDSLENSNCFDFPNGSEDEKNKNERDLGEPKRDKLSRNKNSSILSLNNDCESMSNTSPALGCISIISPSQENLNHSSTPVIINEISSQLDNIKKELETLEAMRLADLKKRICKA